MTQDPTGPPEDEEEGLIDDPQTHVPWLLPVVGGLVLCTVCLLGAYGFWVFVLNQVP